MPVTVRDVRERIRAELAKEIEQIGTGGCAPLEARYDVVAMTYQQRVGYVTGLQAVLRMIEELERDN